MLRTIKYVSNSTGPNAMRCPVIEARVDAHLENAVIGLPAMRTSADAQRCAEKRRNAQRSAEMRRDA